MQQNSMYMLEGIDNVVTLGVTALWKFTSISL